MAILFPLLGGITIAFQNHTVIVANEGFGGRPAFRDRNKNGKMDVYEDATQPVEPRVSDLLAQMTVEEKAGMMFINGTVINADGSIDKKEGGQGPAASSFSQWPEQLGFAAIGDEQLMRRFADIARQEYLAVGIREALHPMADLATEPRWPRVNGTFGEDAQLSARMVKAYVLGFQGNKLDSNGVACVTKHFSGGGPQKEGLDSHFEFHKGQVYPGKNFNYHLLDLLL